MSSRMIFTLSTGQEPPVDALAWVPAGRPLCIVHVSHGMAEHKGRYEVLARYLADRGVACVAHDHRGHGPRAQGEGSLGYLGPDGFHGLCNDLHRVMDHSRSLWPGVPLVLLGHSMGSFVAQYYLTVWPGRRHAPLALAGLILSGTDGPPGPLVPVGYVLAGLQTLALGPRKTGTLLDHLAFSSFSLPFERRTPFDWLSSDSAVVDAYIADPLCGKVHSVSYFFQLSQALLAIHRGRGLHRIPAQLPVCLIAGERDPVGHDGTGPQTVARILGKQEGRSRAPVLHLYPQGRHEVLNEVFADQVRDDLWRWLEREIVHRHE